MFYLEKRFCLFFFRNLEQFQENEMFQLFQLCQQQSIAWLVISAQLHSNLQCKNTHVRGSIPLFQISRTPATQHQSNEFWNSVIYVPHINTLYQL